MANFNADFFVVCATVIPVLFIALIVQDGGYNSLLKAGQRGIEDLLRDSKTGSSRSVSAWSTMLVSVASVLCLAGVGGEVLALLALYWRDDGYRLLVLIMTLALVGAVGFNPVRGYVQVRLDAWKQVKIQLDAAKQVKAKLEVEIDRLEVEIDCLSQGEGSPEGRPADAEPPAEEEPV